MNGQLNMKAEDYIERGITKRLKDDLDGALADFNKAVELYLESAVAYNNLGNVKANKDNLDGALADFDKAIMLNPAYAVAYYNRGITKNNRGDLEGALADYDKSIKLNTDYVVAYINRGNAKSDKGDLDGAIADYDKSMELFELSLYEVEIDKEEIYNNRGIAKYDNDDYEGALSDFDQAILYKSDFVEAYINRGILKNSCGGLWGSASADYDNAIKHKPDNAEDYYNCGNLGNARRQLKMNGVDYVERGKAKYRDDDPCGAIADYNKAIQHNHDDTDAYFNRGNAKLDSGDLDGAIIDYDKVIKLFPDDSESYNKRGNAKYYKGDLDGALADYDKAIELDLYCEEAYINRGNTKSEKGDLDGALVDYDKALEINPDYEEAINNPSFSLFGDRISKPEYAQVYNNRGNVKFRKGELDGALADFAKAIALYPQYPGAYNNRGNAKDRKGDLNGALADFDKAIELNDRYADAFNNRGIVKSDKGDLNGALADFDKAIELKQDQNSRSTGAYYNRGFIKCYEGDLVGAVVDYDLVNKIDSKLSDLALDLRIAKVTEKFKSLDERILVLKLKQDIDKLLKTISKQLETKAEDMQYTNHNTLESPMNETSFHQFHSSNMTDRSKNQVVHYTNLNTLKYIVQGADFRLFNSFNLTDRSEGQVFFELLSLNKLEQENIRKTFASIHDSNVYFGSFVLDSHTDVGDDMMWRTYGKHEGKENAGCALVFEQNNFENKWTSLNSHRALSQDSELALIAESVTHKDLFLFPVIYHNTKTMTEEIKNKLANLGSTLSRLQDIKCKKTIELISDMLNIVRFLFKHKKYSRENEARLVIWRKDTTGRVVKREPPRRYIECPLNLKSFEVIYGQDVRGVEDWKSWVDESKCKLRS